MLVRRDLVAFSDEQHIQYIPDLVLFINTNKNTLMFKDKDVLYEVLLKEKVIDDRNQQEEQTE